LFIKHKLNDATIVIYLFPNSDYS